jgi:competence protein ComEA
MGRMDALNTKAIKHYLGHWVAFVGIRRLVVGITTSLAVSIAVWLLVRPSAPLVESVVPIASGVGTEVIASSVPTPLTVKVHVAGAVVRPGVYELSSLARVVDAVKAAGGASLRADLERINLAQTLVDTEQVFVPSRSSGTSKVTTAPRLKPTRTTVVSSPGVATSPSASPIGAGSSVTRVNINTATSDQLDALPGVGPATSKAIISYRTRKGPFGKVEDLLNVPGIGPAKVAALRDFVAVN